MELTFYKNNGYWSVMIDTTQGEIPAMLNDSVKDAIRKALDKFNRV